MLPEKIDIIDIKIIGLIVEIFSLIFEIGLWFEGPHNTHILKRME